MNATLTSSQTKKLVNKWIHSHYTLDKITDELSNEGHSEQSIEEYLRLFKKEKNSRRQFNSFVLLGIGTFIGFVGCLFSIINPFPDYYYWFLYSSTGIGACVIIAGFYVLLEG